MDLVEQIDELTGSLGTELSHQQASRISKLHQQISSLPASERKPLQDRLWKPLERYGLYRAS